MMKFTLSQTNQPGPRQLKLVQSAIQEFLSEHKYVIELNGVIGGIESRNTYLSLFGVNVREDVSAAWDRIGNQYGWLITKDNHKDLIESLTSALPALRNNRPIDDKRISQEKHEANMAACAAAEAKRIQEATARECSDTLPSTSSGSVTVRRNHEKDGVEIRFSTKPAESVLTNLKMHGWRWARGSKCWYKKYSESAMSFANSIAA
jgi:hypothetical protein